MMTTSSHNPYGTPEPEPADPPADWKTWSPFQSGIVREICAHMTAEEKSASAFRGMLYGLWVAVSVALPLQLIFRTLRTGNPGAVVATCGGILIVIHLITIPFWQKRQRQFLCSTQWARKNGIKPENVMLFPRGNREARTSSDNSASGLK